MRSVRRLAPGETQQIRGMQAAGLQSGVWSAFGRPGDLPPDQRPEDGMSLCFDTEPLTEDLEILGFPTVTLKLSSDQPDALITVRLCDVDPTGASTLMTRGFLNLTHRDSHEFPEALEPGQEYTVSGAVQGRWADDRRGQSHPARAFADVLAVCVAVAGRGDLDDPARR